ncbi:MAG: polyprenyl synthetase family protein [Clostridiales bacterium]|nr:polyprenyl synthetase family protein [Clostridiales bacterium]
MSELFDERLADWKEQIDAELKNILDSLEYADEFKEILEYALFPGGKRLRPILLLEWHSVFSPPDEYALRYACGIEILHSYSLIHDDMPCMDNDDLRRGKPTVHKKYGEGKALLAGDALMDLAYRILNMPTPRGDASPFNLYPALCGDMGLINGQFIDLYGKINSLDDLVKMYRLKTGALIKLACVSGFMLGNNLNYQSGDKFVGSLFGNYVKSVITDRAAPEDERMIKYVMASGFGEAFGCAFQLYDDITEYIAGEKLSETSALKFIDLEEAKIALNNHLNDAAKTLEIVGGDTEYLSEFLQKFVIV